MFLHIQKQAIEGVIQSYYWAFAVIISMIYGLEGNKSADLMVLESCEDGIDTTHNAFFLLRRIRG